MMGGQRDRVTVILDGPWRRYQIAALPGWEMIGTVQQGLSTGALGRSRVGTYAQINAGAVRSLPHNKVLAAIAQAEAAR